MTYHRPDRRRFALCCLVVILITNKIPHPTPMWPTKYTQHTHTTHAVPNNGINKRKSAIFLGRMPNHQFTAISKFKINKTKIEKKEVFKQQQCAEVISHHHRRSSFVVHMFWFDAVIYASHGLIPFFTFWLWPLSHATHINHRFVCVHTMP